MSGNIIYLVVVMLLVGAAGGVVNYYTQSGKNAADSQVFRRFIVLGMVAPFLVPFVLELFGSTLIAEVYTDSGKMLNYVAICLAAAFVPRFFVTNVSESILAETRTTQERVEALQLQLKQLQDELLPLIDTETEADNPAEVEYSPAEGQQDDLDVTSSTVLKTLGCGRFIYRSQRGLCNEADIDESTMSRTLSYLTLKSLAGKVGGRKGIRWYITERGRRVMGMAA